VQTVFAATIYGTIYEFSLDKAKDVRVEINTEPKQFYISKNGSYAFNVPNGEFIVEANQYVGNLLKSSTNENVTISDDGAYVLDLILFPIIDEEELEEDIDIIDPYPERKLDFTLVFIFGVLIIIFFIFYTRSKKRTSEKDGDVDLEKIIKIIKQEGGRATQKEIRKEIPLSEAKISLMIAELEHKGIVEKIKKGRGNIIILKKK
ncbi:MAG: hypothetical protein IIC74_08050, partial [Bacteroidetes bacterium]|nr:hypothetical protein [Bacteroidota bacterium]